MILESSSLSAQQERVDFLWNQYVEVRTETESLCRPLQIEDYGIQTCAEISPPKWHLAHTAWFFETLLLKPFLKTYEVFHPMYGQLFNSYYDTIGQYHPRPDRGFLSRPTVEEVYAYRKHVDEHMHFLLQDINHSDYREINRRTILGLNHEQQHQELILTDIKNIFAYNPLRPEYTSLPESKQTSPALLWHEIQGGLRQVGAPRGQQSFCYDNEHPRHKVYVDDFKIANRPVTNGEYLEFMEDGAYRHSEFWLSDAWKIIQKQHWCAPLYWEKIGSSWHTMTLSGLRLVNMHEPVCHVSCYEAMAYARWAKKRLPTEMEWEIVAAEQEVTGNFRDNGFLHPNTHYGQNTNKTQNHISKIFGDVWEWTKSSYCAYPGYKQAFGPMGEYNGKFMSNQMVLRGGSCVTPADHIRSTYRNFFYPHERWQFCGIRLAEDLS